MTKICEQTEVLDKQSNSNELNFTGTATSLILKPTMLHKPDFAHNSLKCA